MATIPKKVEKKDAIVKPDLSFLQVWSENKNIKKTAEELEIQLIEIYAKISEAQPTWDEDKKWTKARQRLYGTFKSAMKSSAAPWYIRLDFISNSYDYGNAHYLKNIDAYEKNPALALKTGLIQKKTDPTGKKIILIPLDERDKTSSGKPNKMKGKPLAEHAWIQTIGGLAIPSGKVQSEEWGAMKVSNITVSGKQADPNDPKYISAVETGKWYKADLTNKTDPKEKEIYNLNVTTQTKFELDEDGMEIGLDDLPSYYDGFFVPLAEIEEYHDAYAEPAKDKTGKVDDNKTVSRRICMTKGQVIDVIPGEDGNSSRIVLDDENIGFSEGDYQESVSCFYNGEITFGKFSEIYVWGDTTKQRKKDFATDEYLEDWNLPTINIKGITVIDLVQPEIDDEEGGDTEEETEESNESVDINEEDKVDDSELSEEVMEDEVIAEPEEPVIPKSEPVKKAPKKSSGKKVASKPVIEESKESVEPEEIPDPKDLVNSKEW